MFAYTYISFKRHTNSCRFFAFNYIRSITTACKQGSHCYHEKQRTKTFFLHLNFIFTFYTFFSIME